MGSVSIAGSSGTRCQAAALVWTDATLQHRLGYPVRDHAFCNPYQGRVSQSSIVDRRSPIVARLGLSASKPGAEGPIHSALSSASNWFSNFIVGLVVPPLVAAVSYGSFALFSGTSFLAIVWVYCFVPETSERAMGLCFGLRWRTKSDAIPVQRTRHWSSSRVPLATRSPSPSRRGRNRSSSSSWPAEPLSKVMRRSKSPRRTLLSFPPSRDVSPRPRSRSQ